MAGVVVVGSKRALWHYAHNRHHHHDTSMTLLMARSMTAPLHPYTLTWTPHPYGWNDCSYPAYLRNHMAQTVVLRACFASLVFKRIVSRDSEETR